MALTRSWSEIAASDLPRWNEGLTRTPARVEQYPFFNERFRSPLVTPRYLYYGPADAPSAYACVLTVAAWPVKMGLIANGPAHLADHAVPLEAMHALAAWAKARGYAFIRVTHPEVGFLEQLKALGSVEEGDPFHRFLAPDSELIVPLTRTEAELLGGFQEVTRRLIRRASETGYDIQTHETPEALAALWPLFESHARRKGLKYRPLASYMALMRLAQAGRCARLDVAWHEGRPVNAILLLRDRDTVHYQLGALDTDALGARPSPSCLLHFRAMRDFQRLGATAYNLGIRAGPVYTFKKKFRPTEIFGPAPRVIVIRPTVYMLWQRFVGDHAPALIGLLRLIRR